MYIKLITKDDELNDLYLKLINNDTKIFHLVIRYNLCCIPNIFVGYDSLINGVTKSRLWFCCIIALLLLLLLYFLAINNVTSMLSEPS